MNNENIRLTNRSYKHFRSSTTYTVVTHIFGTVWNIFFLVEKGMNEYNHKSSAECQAKYAGYFARIFFFDRGLKHKWDRV